MLLSLILLLFFFANIYLLFASFDIFGLSALVFLSNFILYAVAISHTISTRKLSLNLIHTFFGYFFLWVVPILGTLSKNYVYFQHNFSTISLIIKAQTIVLYWNIVFYGIYFLLVDRVILYFNITHKPANLPNSRVKIFFFIIIAYAVIIFLYQRGGAAAFLFRATEILEDVFSPILRLFYAHFLRPLSFSLFFIQVLLVREELIEKKRISLFFLGLSALILNFPTAPARFYTLSILLSVYAVTFMRYEKNGIRFLLYLPIGLVGSFLIDAFRNAREFAQVSFSNNISIKFAGVLHFDAYETLMMSIKYVEKKGIIYGENLLGAVTFFIPRNLWENKPITTSFLLVRSGMPEKAFSDDPNFENISCPLIGESFISFGLVGVFLFAIFTAVISAAIDSYFRRNYSKKKDRTIVSSLLLILLAAYMGLFLFNLRGALMSTFSYTVGFTLAYLVALRFSDLKILMRFNLLKLKIK